MRISVVTPLYASAPYIEELYERSVNAIVSVGAVYEIVFVNDASPDDSLVRAKALADKDPNVVVMDLSRNFGQHRALMTGIAAARGDYVYICDSDLEEEPEWISKFYSEMRRTNCDVVFGVQSNKKGGFFYSIFRRMFYGTLNFLSTAQFPESVTTARLMSRRYVDAFLEYEEREIYLTGIFHMVGFSQLPCKVVKLDSSPTTYRLSQLAGIFINAVTAFSVRPLMAIGVAGVVLSFGALLFFAQILYRKFFYGIAVEGWTSVMAVTLSIGGLSVLFNGIIAIYIAKIFLEVKQRPVTIVREIYSSEKILDTDLENIHRTANLLHPDSEPADSQQGNTG